MVGGRVLPEALDLLFTDEPYIDFLADFPWRPPDETLSDLTAAVDALVADPRSARLTVQQHRMLRTPAPAVVAELCDVVDFLCGSGAVRGGPLRGLEYRLARRFLSAGGSAAVSERPWYVGAGSWRPPGGALFAAAGTDPELRADALGLTRDLLGALEGLEPLEPRRRAVLALYEKVDDDESLRRATLEPDEEERAPASPASVSHLTERWAVRATDDIVTALPELTGPVGYLSWLVDGWCAVHERLSEAVPGVAGTVSVLGELLLSAGVSEPPPELAVGLRGELYPELYERMPGIASEWSADHWEQQVRGWLARALVAGDALPARAWLDLSARITAAVQGLPGVPCGSGPSALPLAQFHHDMRQMFRVRTVRHPLSVAPGFTVPVGRPSRQSAVAGESAGALVEMPAGARAAGRQEDAEGRSGPARPLNGVHPGLVSGDDVPDPTDDERAGTDADTGAAEPENGGPTDRDAAGTGAAVEVAERGEARAEAGDDRPATVVEGGDPVPVSAADSTGAPDPPEHPGPVAFPGEAAPVGEAAPTQDAAPVGDPAVSETATVGSAEADATGSAETTAPGSAGSAVPGPTGGADAAEEFPVPEPPEEPESPEGSAESEGPGEEPVAGTSGRPDAAPSVPGQRPDDEEPARSAPEPPGTALPEPQRDGQSAGFGYLPIHEDEDFGADEPAEAVPAPASPAPVGPARTEDQPGAHPPATAAPSAEPGNPASGPVAGHAMPGPADAEHAAPAPPPPQPHRADLAPSHPEPSGYAPGPPPESPYAPPRQQSGGPPEEAESPVVGEGPVTPDSPAAPESPVVGENPGAADAEPRDEANGFQHVPVSDETSPDALAAAYRVIDAIVGQDALTAALREAASTPEHAIRLLVAGPPGTGRGMTIDALTKILAVRGFTGAPVRLNVEEFERVRNPDAAVAHLRERLAACQGERLVAIDGLDRLVTNEHNGHALAAELQELITTLGARLQIVGFAAGDGYRRIVDANAALAAWWRVVRTRDFDANNFALIFARVVERRGASVTEQAAVSAGELLAATPVDGELQNARLATYLADLAISAASRRSGQAARPTVGVPDLPPLRPSGGTRS